MKLKRIYTNTVVCSWCGGIAKQQIIETDTGITVRFIEECKCVRGGREHTSWASSGNSTRLTKAVARKNDSPDTLKGVL